MDKEVMDKLMEIKKLYEAGILTKEEMEAEKAKVLYSPETTDKQDEPVVEETEIAPDAQPLPMDMLGRVIFDEPVKEHKEEDKSQDNNSSVNKTFLWVAIAVMVILLIVLVAASNKSNDNNDSPSYNSSNEEYVDVDSCTTDDRHESFDTESDDNDVNYQERAETYISGLSSDTKVVASLTDDERHCVYTLLETEAGWGRVYNLYYHDLETGVTDLAFVPNQVEEADMDQIADAKLVGDNLYVINTSYRCGDCVVCGNTYTGKWSVTVKSCSQAKFLGGNKLKVTSSKLVYEGEYLADNQYEVTNKVITLK